MSEHPTFDRPSPRYVQKYDRPMQPDASLKVRAENTQRRPRAEKNRASHEVKHSRPPQKRPEGPLGRGVKVIRIVTGTVLLSFLIILIFSFFSFSQAQNRLESLRAQRQAAEDQHQKDIGYYVQMRRVSGVDEYIRKYAQEFSVDRSFISAIIARESHYVATAQSGVGARGLMQIMPDTGIWVAGRLAVQPYNYDRLFEPELNIRLGSWYLNYLSSQFSGEPVMIAAAFHAGANNVKQWALKYGEDQKTIGIDQIPTDDTKDYVKKVMNAYALYYEYDISH